MIPPSLQSIVDEYISLETPREKFQFLGELADELPPFDDTQKVPVNEVKGCASKAWIVITQNAGKIFISGEGEAQISKGILAFFSLGLSGCTVEEIKNITDDDLKKTGILTSLSPSRSNGALSIWERIKKEVQMVQ